MYRDLARHRSGEEREILLALAEAEGRHAAHWEQLLGDRIGVKRAFAPVADTRRVGKADMPLNDATPRIEVKADTFEVRIDGEIIEPDPVTELPMAQRYFLF